MRTLAKIILCIILLALVLLVGSQLQAQRIQTINGQVTVQVTDQVKYPTAVWTTYGDGNFFSEIKTQPTKGLTIVVEELANIWLIGKDTLSIWVITPASKREVLTVYIDGKCTRNSDTAPRRLWGYEEFVPLINEYYADGDQEQ